MSDYWSLSYKNIPVWGYLKFYFTDKEESPYRVETISYWKSLPSSFFFLFVFIFLRLRRVNVVTCLISRKEIDDFVSFYMGETSRVKFFRPENNKGNTLFIELVWYLYRRFGYLLDLLGYKRLVQDLGDLGVDNKESVKKAKLIVGDYYYNYFISFFFERERSLLF